MLLAAVTAFAGAVGSGIYNRLAAIPVEAVPLTALLRPSCEDLVVGQKSLKSAPKRLADLTPQWARSEGGGSVGRWELIVQGKTDQIVVLTGLEVLELERASLPPGPIVVEAGDTCSDSTGGFQPVRYLDADLTRTPPRISARKGSDPVNSSKTTRIAFPYNVSRSVAEVIDLETSGKDGCLCSWKLGVRWASGGKSGMLELDRGSDGKILTSVVDRETVATYAWDDDKLTKFVDCSEEEESKKC